MRTKHGTPTPAFHRRKTQKVRLCCRSKNSRSRVYSAITTGQNNTRTTTAQLTSCKGKQTRPENRSFLPNTFHLTRGLPITYGTGEYLGFRVIVKWRKLPQSHSPEQNTTKNRSNIRAIAPCSRPRMTTCLLHTHPTKEFQHEDPRLSSLRPPPQVTEKHKLTAALSDKV